MDDSNVMMNYISSETGNVVTAYGKIQRMFVHRMFDDESADSKVVIQADWYEHVGTNPVNGLPQVQFNPNFNACSLAFLDQCIPQNFMFGKSDPWNPNCDLFVVILK